MIWFSRKWFAASLAPLCVAFAISTSFGQIPGPVLQLTSAQEAQNSPDIAFFGNLVVAVWRHLGYGPPREWSLSTDGGRTWQAAGTLPDPAIGFVKYGYPRVAINSQGRFLVLVPIGRALGTQRYLNLYGGEYDGSTIIWSLIATITPGTESPDELNRVWFLCDSSNDYLYLIYTRGFKRVEFMRSLDRGVTWSLPTVLSSSLSSGTAVTLGPNGELYVLWEEYLERVVGTRSTDHGLTFSPQFAVAPTKDVQMFRPPGWTANEREPDPLPLIAGSGWLPSPNVSLAVDRSKGPRNGRLYAVWSEYADVVMRPVSRSLAEVEPNERLETANPMAPGDAMSGYMESADVPGSNDTCDVFTFQASRGMVLSLAGTVSSSRPKRDGIGLSLYCKDAQDSLFGLWAQIVETDRPSVPFIFTVPEDGTYYLIADCAGGATHSYTFQINVLDAVPTSIARDHRDVVMVTSDDGGATWSPKRRVNDDPPYYDNSFPGVGVTGDGTVHVAWYDRRDALGCPTQVSTYWTYSQDGGATFQPSERLHASTFDLRRGRSSESWKVGDYILMHPEGDDLWVLWAEATGYDDVDVFMSKIVQIPTEIMVDRLQVSALEGGIRLSWWTQRDAPIRSFFVYRREETEGREQVIAEVLPRAGEQDYALEDANVEAGRSYRYRLEVVLADGSRLWLGPVTAAVVPSTFDLAIHPNPSRVQTSILVSGVRAPAVRLEVVDVSGRIVRSYSTFTDRGRATISWDGRDAFQQPVSSGMYLVRATDGSRTVIRRLVRIH